MSSQATLNQTDPTEQLRQVQLIVQNSHDAIIGTTLEGIITSWNGGAQTMFGYSQDEVIGKSGSNLFPPEMWEQIPALLKKIALGEVVDDYDTGGLRKDGTRFDMAISLSPIRAEDGTIIGASVVERDITRRKKVEESLRQTRLIVEHSHDAIVGCTLDGTITSWNRGAEKMFGYSADEVVQTSGLLLYRPEQREEVLALLSRVARGEEVLDYEAERLRKDGSVIFVSVSLSPVLNEAKTIIGVSVVERDMTERNRAEKRIKDLSDVRSKFISILAHQLRTPLTSVNWNLEMMLNGQFGQLEEAQEKFLRVTYQSSIEITHRIHNLLTAIDIEEHRAIFQKEEMSLQHICAEVVNELKKPCELKNISLIYHAPIHDLSVLHGDDQKMRMVISVFVENAIQYTEQGGEISVTLNETGGRVRFQVQDSGVGIPASEQHHIFTRFFRASNASVMKQDGFGLDLYIAQSIIEQHEGTIGFESVEGKGSLFWFEIPTKKIL